MAKKKKRNSRWKKLLNWKFSDGGVFTFMVFLFFPLIIGIVRILINKEEDQRLLGLLFLVIAFLPYGLLVYHCIKQGYLRIARSWYEAGFATYLVYLFYAVFIFVTGYTPSKYNSHPLDRVEGWWYLLISFVPLSIAIIAYIYDKRANEPKE